MDWTVAAGSLGIGSVDRGVTAGIARPGGGGSFVYGFNSLAVVNGAVALFANQVNYAPMAEGGSIRAAIQRGVSGGDTGWSPLVFLGLQGTSVNDYGYLLGLSDGDPPHLVLKKGRIVDGVPDLVPDAPTNKVLLRSTAEFAVGDWVHARLDSIVNGTGDVVLRVYRSASGDVTAPSWVLEPGMEMFIDDALGVNSGSAPYTSGRAGFGMQVIDVTRRAYFDHIEVLRQL
jgi:hypothetical protein